MRKGNVAACTTLAPSESLAMYFAIIEAGIPDLVAKRHLSDRTPLVIRDDVTYGLIMTLERAILGSDGCEPWADVSLVRDHCAWAYSLLASRVAYVIHDVMKERRHLSESTIDELENVLVSPQPDPSEENLLAVLEDVPVDENLQFAAGLRRLHMQAEHLRKFLQVPSIHAPFNRTQRDQLLALIVASPHVAIDSLDRICGGSDGSKHPLDALWENYSPTAASRLLAADHRTIQLLVTAALSPRSRPGRALLRAHRKLIKQLSDQRGWPTLAANVQRAWLAEFYSHTPDKGIRRAPDSVQPEWEAATSLALTHRDRPLGNTSEEIDQAMCRLLRDAEHVQA